MEAKLKKIPGYLAYLKTNPRCTHFTSTIILRFTREIDKKGFFDKYLYVPVIRAVSLSTALHEYRTITRRFQDAEGPEYKR